MTIVRQVKLHQNFSARRNVTSTVLILSPHRLRGFLAAPDQNHTYSDQSELYVRNFRVEFVRHRSVRARGLLSRRAMSTPDPLLPLASDRSPAVP
jgi:hypothetical protein